MLQMTFLNIDQEMCLSLVYTRKDLSFIKERLWRKINRLMDSGHRSIFAQAEGEV